MENNLLGSYKDSAKLPGKAYTPDPEIETMVGYFDRIIEERKAGEAGKLKDMNDFWDQHDYLKYVNGMPDKNPERAKYLESTAIQLKMLGRITDFQIANETEPAKNMFLNFFCRNYNVKPNKLLSVFAKDSQITHPYIQTMVMRLLMKTNPELDKEKSRQLMFAVRWHRLPKDKFYTMRLLGASLAVLGFRESRKGNPKSAASLYKAVEDLKGAVKDFLTAEDF